MHFNKIKIDTEDLKYLYCETKLALCDIAEELYISNRTLYRVLKKLGLKKRKNIRRINLDKNRLVYMQKKHNNNYSKIARFLGVSKQTVMRRCKEYGIFIKVYDKQKEVQLLYFDKELSMRQIATVLNISTKTICEYFKRNNWIARESGAYFRKLENESYVRNNNKKFEETNNGN